MTGRTPGLNQPVWIVPCENFLYVFKAARWAARAADSASWPTLTLSLPLRPDQRRSAGAKDETRAAQRVVSFTCARGSSLLPLPDCPGLVRTRQGRL